MKPLSRTCSLVYACTACRSRRRRRGGRSRGWGTTARCSSCLARNSAGWRAARPQGACQRYSRACPHPCSTLWVGRTRQTARTRHCLWWRLCQARHCPLVSSRPRRGTWRRWSSRAGAPTANSPRCCTRWGTHAAVLVRGHVAAVLLMLLLLLLLPLPFMLKPLLPQPPPLLLPPFTTTAVTLVLQQRCPCPCCTHCLVLPLLLRPPCTAQTRAEHRQIRQARLLQVSARTSPRMLLLPSVLCPQPSKLGPKQCPPASFVGCTAMQVTRGVPLAAPSGLGAVTSTSTSVVHFPADTVNRHLMIRRSMNLTVGNCLPRRK